MLDPLAYATAKTYGLTEECTAILEVAGLNEEEISLPAKPHVANPPELLRLWNPTGLFSRPRDHCLKRL
jgi:hypothetical protein